MRRDRSNWGRPVGFHSESSAERTRYEFQAGSAAGQRFAGCRHSRGGWGDRTKSSCVGPAVHQAGGGTVIQDRGTLASLSDVLAYEASGRKRSGGDVEEVGNYVVALEYGIERLESLPISFRLVNELHERLMSGVRGEDKMPGHFRTTQVWIGAPGSSIRDARFVPPPPERLRDLFFEWRVSSMSLIICRPWFDAR